MPPIHEMSATELIAAYRDGTLTRREVVAAQLDRIDQVNPSTNGVIYRFDEQALKEAEDADANAAQRTHLPLDGVPILISDLYNIAGVPQALGVPALKDNVAEEDDVIVRRLRAAGAIILGKTAVPEYLVRWNTVSELFGQTRNARNPDLAAGGSGGGAATSVAAGLAPLAIHGDLGGSLRVPASWCGVLTLRPTGGVVPLAYVGNPSLTWEQWFSLGPFARTMEDAWLALRAIAGPDPAYPKTVPLELPDTLPAEPARTKVAVMAEATGCTVTPEVQIALEETVGALEEKGFTVTRTAPPNMARLSELWAQMIGTEVLRSLLPPVLELLSENAKQNMEATYRPFDLGPDMASYVAAEQELNQVTRELSEFMDEYHYIVSPVSGMLAPPAEFDHFKTPEENGHVFDTMRSNVWVNTQSLPAVALGNGIQIVGRRYHDTDVAAVGALVRNQLGPIQVATPTVTSKPAVSAPSH